MEGGQMQEVVAALEGWLASNAPPLLELLNPPATTADIAAFEARHALALPPEPRSLYLTHDGEADGSDGIFGCWRWLPLKEVTEEIELIGSTGIVPLFRSGGGDLYYVKSYNPAAPDQRLYEWWHEVPEKAEVIADSLERFITRFVADLRAGQYVYRPTELAALIDRREL
jgi:cell wall assembly regulator SMI1